MTRVRAHVTVLILLAGGCNLQEKLEQRVGEEIAERVVEAAGDDEVDVEIKDGKVTVKTKDGQVIEADGEKGTYVQKDANGKTMVVKEQGDNTVTAEGSDGTKMVAGDKLPADLPLKLPAIKEAQAGVKMEQPDGSTLWSAQFLTESKDQTALAADFEAQLKAKGVEIKRMEQKGATSVVTLIGQAEDKSLLISVNLMQVAEGRDNAGHQQVTISYQQKKPA